MAPRGRGRGRAASSGGKFSLRLKIPPLAPGSGVAGGSLASPPSRSSVLQRGLDDGSSRRRRRGSARPLPDEQDADGHLRVLERRERGEPRVRVGEVLLRGWL